MPRTVERRTLLKGIGAAGFGGIVGSAGLASADSGKVASSGNEELVCYVYEDRSALTSEADTIAQALATFYDRAVEFGLGGYAIYRRQDGIGATWDSLSDFESWCTGKGFDEAASHLAVQKQFGVNQAATQGGVGFVEPVYAYIDYRDMETIEEAKNLGSQETGHAFIDNSLSGVKDLTGSDNNEHSLGVVYSDGSVSPMATKGTDSDDFSSKGNCSKTNAWLGYFKNRATNCTAEAIDITDDEYT